MARPCRVPFREAAVRPEVRIADDVVTMGETPDSAHYPAAHAPARWRWTAAVATVEPQPVGNGELPDGIRDPKGGLW